MKPLLLFAHGAGAPSSSSWMRAWANRLQSVADVVTFDYPYMRERRRAPDPLPRLIEAHRAALREAQRGRSGSVLLAGKSMGGRVGCHVALEEPVDGVICFGYPLRAAGKSGKLRDGVLLELRSPVLFIQGSRDALCPLETLRAVREKMRAQNELYVVEGGDHSLLVTKTELARSGRAQSEVDQAALDAVVRFVSSLQ
jgi:predicted alpha/beta-hydrolase family hydrolase